tara:strand:- start:246 stop:620 length:375 start_codon:yes stop_codon:yes gene_type:complete
MITENNFITKLEGRSIDIYGLPQWKNRKDDNYDCDASIQIDWELYFEMRTWGLKSVSAYATNVNVEILVNWWNDDDTPEMETIEIGTQGEWEIVNDTDRLEFGDCIEPQDAEIDFETKTITIIF